jgi:hypothetical protein
MDYNAQFFSVEMMSHEFFCPGWPGTADVHLCAQLLFEKGLELFFPGWPQTMILLMSAPEQLGLQA